MERHISLKCRIWLSSSRAKCYPHMLSWGCSALGVFPPCLSKWSSKQRTELWHVEKHVENIFLIDCWDCELKFTFFKIFIYLVVSSLSFVGRIVHINSKCNPKMFVRETEQQQTVSDWCCISGILLSIFWVTKRAKKNYSLKSCINSKFGNDVSQMGYIY